MYWLITKKALSRYLALMTSFIRTAPISAAPPLVRSYEQQLEQVRLYINKMFEAALVELKKLKKVTKEPKTLGSILL